MNIATHARRALYDPEFGQPAAADLEQYPEDDQDYVCFAIAFLQSLAEKHPDFIQKIITETPTGWEVTHWETLESGSKCKMKYDLTRKDVEDNETMPSTPDYPE